MMKKLILSLSVLPLMVMFNLSEADAAFGVSKDAKQRSVDVCKAIKSNPNATPEQKKLLAYCDGTTFHCTTHKKGGIFGVVKGVCDAPNICADKTLMDACQTYCVDNRRSDDKTSKIKQKLNSCTVHQAPLRRVTVPADVAQPNIPQVQVSESVQPSVVAPTQQQRRRTISGRDASLPSFDGRRGSIAPTPQYGLEQQDNPMSVMEVPQAAPVAPIDDAFAMPQQGMADQMPADSQEPAMVPQLEMQQDQMVIPQDSAQFVPPPPPPPARTPLAASAPEVGGDNPLLEPSEMPTDLRQSDGGRGALLDSIRNGRQLNKAVPNDQVQSSEGRDGLLSQIRQGQQLKKVDPASMQKPKTEASGLVGVLGAAMGKRRFDLREDESTGASNDKEWED